MIVRISVNTQMLWVSRRLCQCTASIKWNLIFQTSKAVVLRKLVHSYGNWGSGSNNKQQPNTENSFLASDSLSAILVILVNTYTDPPRWLVELLVWATRSFWNRGDKITKTGFYPLESISGQTVCSTVIPVDSIQGYLSWAGSILNGMFSLAVEDH